MGNDGGTIVRRADLVRVREDGKASVDPAVLSKVVATTCALSNKPLANPVVSDSLGRLYNKDSVVTYLLQRGEEKGKKREDRVAGHLRGLKDIRELKLAVNAAANRDVLPSSSTEEDLSAPFICPLTEREMNGKHRFVYLSPCGCVMSESGLRAVVAEQTSKDESQSSVCPVCGNAFSTSTLGKREIQPGGDVVIINGTDGEVEGMLRSLEKKREVELARRKELKSQTKELTEGESEERRKKKEEKRKRREEVVKMLEAEEKRAKREDGEGVKAAQPKVVAPVKEMSAAMRSIYGLDKPKQTGETWMTRGTFNRFA